MNLFALDLAIHTGFCQGDTDAPPSATDSGSIHLVRADEPIEQAAVNLACFLRDRIRLNRPDLIGVEQWLDPSAQPSSATVISSMLLHGAVISVAGMCKIPVVRVPVSTWRLAFCGRATANRRALGKQSAKQKEENRKANKMMVASRAALLGYIPKNCSDYDRADSCGVFDYFGAKYGRRPASALHLFDEVNQ